MSKFLSVITVCVMLSACVIYTPTDVTYSTVVHNETTSSTILDVEQKLTNGVSERVTRNALSSKQRTLADCDNFVLPRDIQKPKALTIDDISGPRSVEALDQLLIAKIDEYRTYIDSMHSKIEQAHQVWLESCQHKIPE